MYRCIDSAIQTPAEFGTGDISRIYPQETIFDNTQRNRMDQQVNSQWHPCQEIISYCTKCCFCTLYFLAVIIVRTSIFIFFSLTKTPLIKYNDLFYSVVLTSSFIDTDHVWIIWLLDERPWHWHPWMEDRSEKSL